MKLPLMSPAALDNAVYELVARKLGVANAMRFIARHNQPDGINYTQDRKAWLPRDPDEIERLLDESASEFEHLKSTVRKNHDRSGMPAKKGVVRKKR